MKVKLNILVISHYVYYFMPLLYPVIGVGGHVTK